ncbi:uncharacterized protein GGS22DRAFT_27057 [Annulohypoxylon maeteangense]|uniref:uncharacterized protein n=1 Tax=Annulohypoxylon maeteangense TaxID=1927788 RepID=UPI00200807F2|nr:uncharacterized protein GGS22DRAFT_27057 [Annulohypoxylon maeteangense]KAI0883886.1 hypothetical protein GGS22DRAFT_27057 [Annulohypoxylon maeteangense]
MVDLVDIALFSLVAIVFIPRIFGTNKRTTNTSTIPIMINRRGGAMIPRRRVPIAPPPDRHDEQQPSTPTSFYEAKPEDIITVKDILSKVRNIPPELVDMILDRAEYWACSATVIDYSNHPQHKITILGARPAQDQFLLRTEPLGLTKWTMSNQDLWRVESAPKRLKKEYEESDLKELIDGSFSTLEHPFRKVVFDIVSCDQGWSSDNVNHGQYTGSWTWFDAGLERFDQENECVPECPDNLGSEDLKGTTSIPTCAIRPIWPVLENHHDDDAITRYHHELLPNEDHLIQRNKHAIGQFQNHHVEWSWDDDVDPDSLAARTLGEAGRGRGTGNGEFLRNLKLGDMITVWGRARFPGWTNNIQRVEVKVYWAF